MTLRTKQVLAHAANLAVNSAVAALAPNYLPLTAALWGLVAGWLHIEKPAK